MKNTPASTEPDSPKLCMKCARRILAIPAVERRKKERQAPKPCADCLLLNVDPMAQVRANAAKPSPVLRIAMLAYSFCSLIGGHSSIPARARTALGTGG